MGIRDTTYYERTLLLSTRTTDHFSGGISNTITKAFYDLSGNFYTVESSLVQNSNRYATALRKSTDAGQSWSTVKTIIGTGSDSRPVLGAVADSSGNLFIGYTAQTGSQRGLIIEKSTNAGLSWSIVHDNYLLGVGGIGATGPTAFMFDVGTHPGNKDHICTWINRSPSIYGRLVFSTTHGNTWQSQSFDTTANTLQFSRISASVYITTGHTTDAIFYDTSIYSASFNAGTSIYNGFITLFSEAFVAAFGNFQCRSVALDSSGGAYVVQHSSSGGVAANRVVVLTASNGKTFGKSKVIPVPDTGFGVGGQVQTFVDTINKVYHVYSSGTDYVEFSANTGSTWSQWSNENLTFFDAGRSGGVFNLPQFFVVKSLGATSELYLMSINAVSSSIGPSSLATSIGYPSAFMPGNPTTIFSLMNVSEFPHAGGFFQMRNIGLGTKTSGKIGSTEDSIIKVSHIGSVVKVMWPKQDSIEKPIRGFGDFSAGERPGKLTTAFQPGEAVDVTEFDHLTLFGYLSKEVSGTLDDVVIIVERKPLKDNSFAIDQSIEYATSGSKTEARLRDVEYKKQIDYGDLSINKIGFPIDIPLTNTKEIRVSVKHRIGQSENNKNFIMWGRFIKASKDTNET